MKKLLLITGLLSASHAATAGIFDFPTKVAAEGAATIATAATTATTKAVTNTTPEVTKSLLERTMTTLGTHIQNHPKIAMGLLASLVLYQVEEHIAHKERMRKLSLLSGKNINDSNINDIKNTSFDFNIPFNPVRWPARALHALITLFSNRSR